MKIEIEKTSKIWKKIKLIAIAIYILSFSLCIYGASYNKNDMIILSIILFVIGLSISIISEIGAWWTNG